MWDGLGFFSFDLKKIARFRDKPIYWTDKFTDPFDLGIMILTGYLLYTICVPIFTEYFNNEEKTKEI